MTNEGRRPLIRAAEGWINPLIEKAKLADQIEGNVAAIRKRVVDIGNESVDKYDNTSFGKTIRKTSGKKRLRVKFTATSPEDPESESRLGLVLSIGITVKEIPAKEKQTLDVKFSSTNPEGNTPLSEDPFPQLYCHIFADDLASGLSYPTEPRRLLDLNSEELGIIFDMTNNVLDFLPQPPVQ